MFTAFLLSFLFTVNATAQTVTLKASQSFGFQIDTAAHATGQMFTFVDAKGQNHSYKLYETASGSPYIVSIGSKGEYPVWVGVQHPTLTLEDGTPLRTSKSGKAVIPYMKPNGHPHVRYLEFDINGNN